MIVETLGIDHVFIAVSDLTRSEAYYDRVLGILGFRKNTFTNDGDPHIQYFNRHFGFVLRPCAAPGTIRQPNAPGLHHFCFRVADATAVAAVARQLTDAGLDCTAPQLYPEYAPDYWAVFFSDPDGLRLEVTNFREERRRRFEDWDRA